MPKTKPPKPHGTNWRLCRPLLLLLLLASAGCATPLQPLPSRPVQPVRLPALPPEARQLPTPPDCLPTCLDALTQERDGWLKLLTPPAPGALPAK